MKNIYITLLLFLFRFGSTAQIVNIPDANLKAKLLQSSTSSYIAWDVDGLQIAIDANGNGEIEFTEAARVDELNINNAGISSATGLEAFVNLKVLECAINQLTEFDASPFPNLVLLYLYYNQLISLDLANNLLLENLDCSYNQIENISFPNFTNPINIYITNNGLTSVDLSHITKIHSLFLRNNQLSTIIFNNPNAYLYDGILDFSNNPTVTIDMRNLHNAPGFNFPMENISITNTPITQIICPPALVKYYGFNNNPNLELISFKNQILENFVGNNVDTGVSIHNNPNLNAVCVDNLSASSQSESEFFIDYFNNPSIVVSTTTCGLGVEDNEISLIKVYPNPASDAINIESSGQDIKRIVISNVLGQTIMAVENATQMNICSLTKGTYFVTVETESGKETQRIIKQ